MGTCLSCGSRLPEEGRFCSECGQGATALRQYSSLLGPILAGVVVGIIGNAAGRLVPTPEGHGFLGSILSIVHRTTFPYFDIAFGFIAGWTATSALGHRRTSTAAIAGLGVAILLTASLAVATLAAHGELHPARLAWMAILAWVGAIIAASAAAPLARSTRVGRLLEMLPGGRPFRAAVGALGIVALLILTYAIVVTVLIVAAVLLILYFLLRLILGGSAGEARGEHRESTSGGSVPRRESAKVESVARRGPYRIWGEDGEFRWRVDAQGLAWDSKGDRMGRIDADGRFWDRTGTYQWRIDEDGKIWNRSGDYRGRIDEQGMRWDKHGTYKGKMKEE